MAKKNVRTCQLETPFEKNSTLTWQEYPRPQLKRDSYISLCGDWQLSVKKDSTVSLLGNITVPYPPESRISGIGRALGAEENYLYKKIFNIDGGFNKGRILIHFGAVDQIAKVWVNNSFVGEHIGGYLPFTFDITEFVTVGENTVFVEVTDALDTDLAYGKQKYDRGGMWYTPVSGIWQSVWIESVPQNYISSLRLTPSLLKLLAVQKKNALLSTPPKVMLFTASAVTKQQLLLKIQ